MGLSNHLGAFSYSEVLNKQACLVRFLRFFFYHTRKILPCSLIKFNKWICPLSLFISKSVLDFQKKPQSTRLFWSAPLWLFKKMPVCSFILDGLFIRDFRVINCTPAIITRGLYVFYPLFEDHFFCFQGGPYVWLVFKSSF